MTDLPLINDERTRTISGLAVGQRTEFHHGYHRWEVRRDTNGRFSVRITEYAGNRCSILSAHTFQDAAAVRKHIGAGL